MSQIVVRADTSNGSRTWQPYRNQELVLRAPPLEWQQRPRSAPLVKYGTGLSLYSSSIPVRDSLKSQQAKYDDDKICRSCTDIEIERHLNKRMKKRIKLGKLRDICTSCGFCRLVRECVRRNVNEWDNKRSVIWIDNIKSWEECIVKSMYGEWGEKGYSNAEDLRSMAKRTSGLHAYRFRVWLGNAIFGQIQYIGDKEPVSERHFFGRRVNPMYANLDLIRSWLPLCQKIHGRSCEESGVASKRLNWLRVIDVDARVVMSAPPGARYIALSYVWGKCEQFLSTKAQVRRDSKGRELVFLPDHLPQTIEDAIYVVKELGEKYLWVDALCIIQDSISERHTQMSRMDAIYNFAALTIAAASGHHANAGLPGISRPRNIPQYTEYADGLQFGLPLPSYDSLESDKSLIWNSRGWTFQEKILSKRILLFTEFQVYFQCSNTVFCEDTVMETDRCSKSVQKRWRPLRWAADRAMGENTKDAGVTLTNYIYAVEAFTKRVITKREDGVNAIQGVLGTLEAEMGTFHVGLPEHFFGQALLWQPKLNSDARRLQINAAPFPSWSWARWELSDGCFWEMTGLASAKLENPVFLLTPNDLVKLHAPDRLNSLSKGLFWTNRAQVTPDPPRLKLSAGADRMLRKLGALLYFQNTIVKLKIGNQFPSNKQQGIIVEDEFYRMRQYKLTDEKGLCVGQIRMAASTRESRATELQSFITICSSTRYEGPPIAETYIPTKQVSSGDGEGTTTVKMKPSEFRMAKIMAVKWVDEVAQRVALGEVVSTAWEKHKSSARWILFG